MRTAALLRWLVLAGIAATPSGWSAAAAPSTMTVAATLPDGVSAADRTAIQDVIRQQMHAFQSDDADGAYAFAAPAIRQMFPDAGQFLAMVRRGYAPVYRPRDVEFTDLAQRDGDLVQDVELVGPDGMPALAQYTMVRAPDGRWLIAGCVLVPSKRLGA